QGIEPPIETQDAQPRAIIARRILVGLGAADLHDLDVDLDRLPGRSLLEEPELATRTTPFRALDRRQPQVGTDARDRSGCRLHRGDANKPDPRPARAVVEITASLRNEFYDPIGQPLRGPFPREYFTLRPPQRRVHEIAVGAAIARAPTPLDRGVLGRIVCRMV